MPQTRRLFWVSTSLQAARQLEFSFANARERSWIESSFCWKTFRPTLCTRRVSLRLAFAPRNDSKRMRLVLEAFARGHPRTVTRVIRDREFFWHIYCESYCESYADTHRESPSVIRLVALDLIAGNLLDNFWLDAIWAKSFGAMTISSRTGSNVTNFKFVIRKFVTRKFIAIA